MRPASLIGIGHLSAAGDRRERFARFGQFGHASLALR
jgi:hypothetical protein